MNAALMKHLTTHGCVASVQPLRRIDDLIADMEKLEKGDFHTGYIDWMAWLREQFYPDGLPFTPRSLIVAASLSPLCQVSFTVQKKRTLVPLPPTYADNSRRESQLVAAIDAFLWPLGYRAAPTYKLPKKLLAVRSGLGRYGRNNICYVGSWGSYVVLNTFFSDLPCEEAPWFSPRLLDECAHCHACLEACPTGAIDPHRLLIDADRCLTRFNENEGNFPDWLPPDAHVCLVGCMRCQETCPANNRFVGDVICDFDERETSAILHHAPGQAYEDALEEKLLSIGMDDYRDILSRNLSAVLGKMTAH